MKKPCEGDIVKACLSYLEALGIFAWRNNTGAMGGTYKGTKRYVRFGVPGASDILGVLPNGRFLAIECKMPGKKPTLKQRAFIDEINRHGGVAFVAESVTDVMGWDWHEQNERTNDD
ncbi:hypothetical protein LCGC14_1129990 [marine sediment metagenome]|uniref:VRR-NUC domain-containing protein n=1 Tax=marine sediment metagenome TaxID=412755 RepID=A0A0F9M1D7_9ZZZZ